LSRKKKPDARAIKDELVERARSTPGGLRISEHALSKEFGVSPSTANRILADLALTGHANRKKGRPTYLHGRTVEESFTIHYVLPDMNALDQYADPNNYRVNLHLLKGVMAAAQKRPCLLNLSLIPPGDFASKVDLLVRHSMRPVFLLSSLREYAGLLAHLDAHNLPRMAYAGYEAVAGPHVRVDGGTAFRELISLLFLRGRRRFLYLQQADPRLQSPHKTAAFRDALEGRGAQAVERVGSEGVRGVATALEARFPEGAPGFDAVVCATDELAMGAADFLKSRRLSIPRDVSLVGYDHSPEARAYSPRFPTVEVPYPEIGEKLVEGCEHIARGEGRPFPAVELQARAVVY